jgi:hypothetical protein
MGITGFISLTSEMLDVILLAVEYELIAEDVKFNDKFVTINSLIPSGQQIEISLDDKISTNLSSYFVANNSDLFWPNFSKNLVIPEQLYIHKLYTDKDFNQENFLDYLNFLIRLESLMTLVSDFQVRSSDGFKEYLLISDKSLKIKLKSKYLSASETKSVDNIVEKLSEEYHGAMYKSMLKIQFSNLLLDVAERDRFQYLVDNFTTLCENFNNSIELYYHNFDINKNKKELDSKLLDLLKKVYGTVNDIGNKVLTIPAAFLLLLTELTKSTRSVSDLLLLILAFTYCLIIQLSLTNQYNYLTQLKAEQSDFLLEVASTAAIRELANKYEIKLNRGIKIQYITLVSLAIILWSLPIFIILDITNLVNLS